MNRRLLESGRLLYRERTLQTKGRTQADVEGNVSGDCQNAAEEWGGGAVSLGQNELGKEKIVAIKQSVGRYHTTQGCKPLYGF